MIPTAKDFFFEQLNVSGTIGRPVAFANWTAPTWATWHGPFGPSGVTTKSTPALPSRMRCRRAGTPPPSRGSPYRLKPETRHNLVDKLSISVLTDQDICLCPAIGKRHHELPPVPKSDDESFPLAIQIVHALTALGPDPYGPSQGPDDPRANRRQEAHF